MRERTRCWTCKGGCSRHQVCTRFSCLTRTSLARRLPCDGGLPACQKCTQAHRKCQGYGTRLSWPRDNDKRRSILGESPPVMRHTTRHSDIFFVNATCRDIELYRHLSRKLTPPRSVQHFPGLWGRPHLRADYSDLVNYCKLEPASCSQHSCAIISRYARGLSSLHFRSPRPGHV